MLFEADRHTPLHAIEWEPARARRAIETIAEDLESGFDPDRFWPSHPLDLDDGAPETAHKSLYLGATGCLWALWYLAREGAIRLKLAPERLIARIDAAYQSEPDTGAVVPSYFLGEAGILLVLWRLTGSAEAADRLWTVIDRNIPNPTNEALWGAPGTMLGACYMHQWTGEPRWRALFDANVEQLWQSWLPDGPDGCPLWTQDLYGEIIQLTGAGHGFAGNVYPLLRGAALLSADRRALLYDRCAETLRATAMVEAAGANWPPATIRSRPDGSRMLVQWCHGAPGMVTALSGFPTGHAPAVESLLLAAGAVIWHSGPLIKGSGLCHGTAGNGYALLELHRRTGDPAWLDRARSFAMHAITQSEAMRQAYGSGRYTLWTGDAGLAVYLWHCLVGAGGLPGLDVLD